MWLPAEHGRTQMQEKLPSQLRKSFVLQEQDRPGEATATRKQNSFPSFIITLQHPLLLKFNIVLTSKAKNLKVPDSFSESGLSG